MPEAKSEHVGLYLSQCEACGGTFPFHDRYHGKPLPKPDPNARAILSFECPHCGAKNQFRSE
jgi:hypothetical protein